MPGEFGINAAQVTTCAVPSFIPNPSFFILHSSFCILHSAFFIHPQVANSFS